MCIYIYIYNRRTYKHHIVGECRGRERLFRKAFFFFSLSAIIFSLYPTAHITSSWRRDFRRTRLFRHNGFELLPYSPIPIKVSALETNNTWFHVIYNNILNKVYPSVIGYYGCRWMRHRSHAPYNLCIDLAQCGRQKKLKKKTLDYILLIE